MVESTTQLTEQHKCGVHGNTVLMYTCTYVHMYIRVQKLTSNKVMQTPLALLGRNSA